jgi:hypothetical protein
MAGWLVGWLVDRLFGSVAEICRSDSAVTSSGLFLSEVVQIDFRIP